MKIPVRFIRLLAAVAMATWTANLLACTSFPVEIDYDPQVQFGELRSYAWLAREKTGDPRLDNDLLDGRIHRAVEAVLKAKGYEAASPGTADFEITYHLGVDQKIDVQTYVDPFPYRWHAGPPQAYTTVREYDVGSLVLDIVNASEKTLIWRGTTQANVERQGTPEQREVRARAAVEAILAKFPPQ